MKTDLDMVDPRGKIVQRFELYQKANYTDFVQWQTEEIERIQNGAVSSPYTLVFSNKIFILYLSLM